MAWVNSEVRLPRHGQWVVIPFGSVFKVGQYDATHPFAPCIVDRFEGKFYNNFQHWKPLTAPRIKK